MCKYMFSQSKYTILAGDITNFKKKDYILTRLISQLKPHTDHIIYILGNHEYYELGQTKVSEVKDAYSTLSNKLGINLLENEHLETDDFIFYGATMWSKMTEHAYRRMSDQFSFTNKEELLDIHEDSKSKLERFITEYKSEKPLIVITHHLPSFTLIDKEYEKYKDLNSGFASELDHLIRDPISYWIYGHTHKSNDTIINNVRLLCNPLGYPGIERANFKDCTF